MKIVEVEGKNKDFSHKDISMLYQEIYVRLPSLWFSSCCCKVAISFLKPEIASGSATILTLVAIFILLSLLGK